MHTQCNSAGLTRDFRALTNLRRFSCSLGGVHIRGLGVIRDNLLNAPLVEPVNVRGDAISIWEERGAVYPGTVQRELDGQASV